MTNIPAEFWLVARCCRWPTQADDSELGRLCAQPIDWERVARIARRHRVEALVWNRLRIEGIPVPDEPARLLRIAAERTARENLQVALECARLKQAFDAAGVAILFIKGITLAMLAYQTLSLKAAHDIDVLVEPHEAEAAADILLRAGYTCIVPDVADAQRVADWHAVWKESAWRHARGGTIVELHTRLVNSPMLLPDVRLDHSQEVELQGAVSLPTLATDELFAYLCVHGTASGWYRLKWLADLGALIAPLELTQVEHLFRRALALGAGRAPGVSLLLCNRILGIPLPDGVRRELERQPISRALARAALGKMTGRHLEREIHRLPFGTLSIHLTQPLLAAGWRFALAEASRLTVRPEDAFELGGSSGPLRRGRLLMRRVAYAFARRSAGSDVR